MNIRHIFAPIAAEWRIIRTNWIISLSTRVVLVSGLLALFFLAWKYRGLPPQVPLWYSRPWGAEQFAHPLWLALLPAGSILWLLVNLVIAAYVARGLLIFVQLLFAAAGVVSILSFIALVKILYLIT